MDSFEKYEFLYSMCQTDSKYGEIVNNERGENPIEEVIVKAKSSIIIASSELRSFLKESIIEKVDHTISSNESINLTIVCGNRIAAKERDGNLFHPFINMIFNKYDSLIENGQFKFYYTHDDLLTQISNGYSHKIIIDGGQNILFEKPHGYEKKSNEYIKIKNDFEYGGILSENLESYVYSENLQQVTNLDEININYLLLEDFKNISPDEDIKDQSDLERKYARLMQERYNEYNGLRISDKNFNSFSLGR